MKKMEGATRRSNRINGPTRSSQLMAARRKGRQAAKKPQTEVFGVRDVYQLAEEAKDFVQGSTGVIYDHRMEEHRCLWDPNYQECPERFTSVIDRCKELGLLERCVAISSREATEDEILRLHSKEHLDKLKETEHMNETELEALSSHYDAIFVHPSTYRLSLLSVGSTIELVDQIVKGNVQNGMAIIRPPGHHAMKSEYCGYCYFNNVALAADYALNKLGLSRILIVDWDVHHGQATQQMFYSDRRVIYFSIHRYEHGTFWPNLRESEFDFIGEGEGIGYNFNIPLNKIQMQDADYMAIFHQVLLPVATEFQPELILISSGYDAAIGCPEGEMEITPACYSHLLSSLMGLASGKIAVVLEGGYYLKSLAEGAALTLRTLLGDPCPNIRNLDSVNDSIVDTILNTIYSHREYWNCFQFQDVFSLKDVNENHEEHFNLSQFHVPEVIFNFNEPRPTIYPTRDCYPRRSDDVIARYDDMLNMLIAETKLVNPKYKVCLVYDPLMMAHSNYFEDHPEKPERISMMFEMHKDFKLLERLHLLQSRIATEEELLLVHSADHINSMKAIDSLPKDCNSDEKSWCNATKQESYHSVYLHRQSFNAAALAAGSLLQVVDSVLTEESCRGVAVIRPPGHHAESNEPCGFCIFNNTALAAKYAISKYNLKKILLLDWDVHHGNGIQHIFEDDPKVLYISLHRYDNGNFFPGSTDAAANVVGSGEGRGFNVNIPWNKRGMGPAEYFAAFHHVVLPIAYEYNPELVIVSAGFDAGVGDPLGGCLVTPEAYAHLTHWLMPLARGRIILSLEGGYNVRTISYSMTMCTKALLGDPLPSLEPGQGPSSSAVYSIKEVLKVQSKFWQLRHFTKALPKENILINMKDKITSFQSGESPTSHLLVNATDDVKIANQLIDFESKDLSSLSKVNSLLISSNEKNMSEKKTDEFLSSLMETVSLEDGDKLSSPEFNVRTVNNDQKSASHSDNKTSDNSFGEKSQPGPSQSSYQSKNLLLECLGDNIQLLSSEQMYAIIPLSDCPHLTEVLTVPSQGIDVNVACVECTSVDENWTCLTCYTVHCGRYINGHMLEHGENEAHPLCLSFSDLSVWCYGCKAYIDNPILFSAKNSAHISKFGSEMPWSYSTPKLQ